MSSLSDVLTEHPAAAPSSTLEEPRCAAWWTWLASSLSSLCCRRRRAPGASSSSSSRSASSEASASDAPDLEAASRPAPPPDTLPAPTPALRPRRKSLVEKMAAAVSSMGDALGNTQMVKLVSQESSLWWAARWCGWFAWSLSYAAVVAIIRVVGALTDQGLKARSLYAMIPGTEQVPGSSYLAVGLATVGHAWLGYALLPSADKRVPIMWSHGAALSYAAQYAGMAIGLGTSLGLGDWWNVAGFDSPSRILQLSVGALLWFASIIEAVASMVSDVSPHPDPVGDAAVSASTLSPRLVVAILTEGLTRMAGWAAWMIVFVTGRLGDGQPLPLWLFWGLLAWHMCAAATAASAKTLHPLRRAAWGLALTWGLQALW